MSWTVLAELHLYLLFVDGLVKARSDITPYTRHVSFLKKTDGYGKSSCLCGHVSIRRTVMLMFSSRFNTHIRVEDEVGILGVCMCVCTYQNFRSKLS